MELSSRTTVQRLLKHYGITPRKALGQNFLVSRSARNALAHAAEITSQDTVIEIGAGLGAITQEIARRAKKVIAIERDEKLCAALTDLFAETRNVKIACADALALLAAHPSLLTGAVVVGNIPYKITGPLLRVLVDADPPPDRIVVMVQKEVANRIVAKPPHMNLLGLAIQHAANATRRALVEAKAFWPAPRVASAVITLEPISHDRSRDQALFVVAKATFGQPRKQLLGSLAKALHKNRTELQKVLAICNIQSTQRPQELSLNNWHCLSQKLIR